MKETIIKYQHCISMTKYIAETGTWNNESSAASCDNIPATKASPAPVVSTGSTFKPLTLPLNSCKINKTLVKTQLLEGKL